MKRFLLDTGIAGKFINRRDGVYERCVTKPRGGTSLVLRIPCSPSLAYGVEFVGVGILGGDGQDVIRAAVRDHRVERAAAGAPPDGADLPIESASPSGRPEVTQVSPADSPGLRPHAAGNFPRGRRV